MQMLKNLYSNKKFQLFNIIVIGSLFLFKTILEIVLSTTGKNEFGSGILNFLDSNWLWVGLSTYVVFIPALKYFMYYKPLFKGQFHMDLLVSLAMHVSYIFSLVFTIIDPNYQIIVEPIGLLYAFNEFSRRIEDTITSKNDSERISLESLKGEQVMMGDGSMKSVSDVKVGEVVMFHKDEIIQFDGVVSMGEVIIDTSNINGEDKPYYAKMNSSITSGTKLKSDMLMLKVTKTFKDSTLNKLIESIQKTNTAVPKMQTFANKLFRWFIPITLVIVLISFITWMIINNIYGINPMASNSSEAVYSAFFVAVSILAVACPCAMTMAAPIVSFVTAKYYWRNNIVFNDVSIMEEINKISHVVLDKTGTLTTGQMEIIETYGEKKYHGISAALEESVYHPIAESIFKKYNSNVKVSSIKELVGKGVSGKYNSNEFFIGKTTKEEIDQTFKVDSQIGTYVGLYSKKKLLAAYILRTEIKKDADQLIAFFRKRQIQPIILSGDNEKATKSLADKFGIDYKAEQSPTDKSKYIQSLQRKKHVVMMIGDGLNDSLAIKNANVSVSFAQGSNITNSYSSISLLDNDLKTVEFLFKMAKKSKLHYLLALFWAMIFNVALIPIAAIGLLAPWLASTAMYVSNVILYIVIAIYWLNLRNLEKDVYGQITQKHVERKKGFKPTQTGHDHHHH